MQGTEAQIDKKPHPETKADVHRTYASGTARTFTLSVAAHGILAALALKVVTSCTAPLLMLYFANTLLSRNCHQS
jgi:hypothetical protein